MPKKPSKRRGQVKSTLKGRQNFGVTLANLIASLGGSETKAAKWAKVSLRTLRDWIKRGVPARSAGPLLRRYGRRIATLRQWDLRRIRAAQATLEGVKKAPPEPKQEPSKTDEEIRANLEFREYLELQRRLATTRDRIEGFDRITQRELPDLTDNEYLELRAKMLRWRRRFEVLRAKRLAVSEFPELRTATADTIDEIARLLAEKHNRTASYFYRKWHSP